MDSSVAKIPLCLKQRCRQRVTIYNLKVRFASRKMVHVMVGKLNTGCDVELHYFDHCEHTLLTLQSIDLMNLNRMQTSSAGYPDTTYASSASPVGGQFAPSSAPNYDAMGYAPAPVRSAAYGIDADPTRRFSQS